MDKDKKNNCEDKNDCNSKDNNINLTILNETAKAAKMGLSSIRYLEEKIDDDRMKNQLSDQYSRYSQIVNRVNIQFKNYGEIPDDTSEKLKMISYMGIQLNTMVDESPSNIATILMQGNYMGIIKCQKLLNHNPYASPEVKKILIDFKEMQEDNIQNMKEFL